MRWLDEMVKIATGENADTEHEEKKVEITSDLVDVIAARVIEKLSENIGEQEQEQEQEQETETENTGGDENE